MDTKLLSKTAAAMVAKGKGLLAADESAGTCEKRFNTIDTECSEANRRAWRDLLLTTRGLEEFVSGVILFDETIRQRTLQGEVPFAQYLDKKGIIPGIKVDGGVHDLALCPGEKVTEGLDGLRKRLAEYFKLGARFAKWRAVINIGEGIPSHTCLYANAHALARYSALCQEASIVPIFEPEVMLDGNHTIERCAEASEATLSALFAALRAHNVSLEHVVLKASMVVPGKDCPKQAGAERVAEETVKCLKRTVPAALPGVVFLSGGQSDEAATAHLNAMAAMPGLPWPLTFSYSRALQNAALKAWHGAAANIPAAQRAFHHRARMNGLASQGKYRPDLEERQAA
jgi:fructose-bisphosphate aldolase, class I